MKHDRRTLSYVSPVRCGSQRSCFGGSLIFLIAAALLGQTASPAPDTELGKPLPTMTLSYGAGKSLTVNTQRDAAKESYQPVVVYVDQVLQVRLQFDPALAGQNISAGTAEEEGEITTHTNSGLFIIGPDGAVTFGYKAPHDPGDYHLGFRFGSHDTAIGLLVRDTSDMGNASAAQRAE